MLYIDRIVIHNFKSFRHANIGFSKGFNCIAGPNGSGKSNVCDSLLFALGEQSLRRMRVSNAAQLMNDKRQRGGEAHTYVKVSFEGDHSLEVLREIRGERIVYRLNGKAITRQEMVEALRQSHCEINETNTITQGETAKLLALSPKERRELIDIAAGIKEFNIKKEDALKELDKVEGKIGNAQVLLNERVGFLEELAKEKEQAERFMGLSNRLKSVSYTILKLREEQLSEEHKKRFQACKDNEAKKLEAERRTAELDERVRDLLSQKEQLTKKLNESSMDASANNRLMEQLSKEIALAEAKLEQSSKEGKELSERGRKLASESERLKLKAEENAKLIEIAEGELANSNADEIPQNGEAERLSVQYRESQEKGDMLAGKRDSLEKDYVHMLSDSTAIERNIEGMRDEERRLSAELADRSVSCTSLERELKGSADSEGSALRELDSLQSKAAGIREEIGKTDSESISIREQLALSGNSDKLGALLSKGLREGYHGRAQDLCTYDEKYALAVAAGSGSRLNYFIVDSIEVAGRAIKLLKDNSAGRATFIPLGEIKVSARQSKQGLQELISCVRFDAKFEKAFSYIFSNTYIIDSIAHARGHGIGANRYVTLGGELVESSGIVSGGSAKAQLPARSLQAKLDALKAKAGKLRDELSSIDAEVSECKKGLSGIESQKVKLEVELRYARTEVEKLKSGVESVGSRLKEALESDAKLKSVMAKVSEEREQLSNELAKERERDAAIYSRLTSSLIGGRADPQELERVKSERKAIEEKKLKVAELRKENSMLRERVGEMDAESKELGLNADLLKSEERKVLRELERRRKELDELREKTKGYDKETQGIYSRIAGLDSSMAASSTEKGRLLSSAERLNSDILENETARAQIEVRLGDIKAELSSYQGSQRVEGAKMGELEAEQLSSRKELESMGAVNLKAPELYERRSRDVEEARQQMSVLENEKSSILEMINQIEAKKLNIFTQTLSAVNKNFKGLYTHIFDGDAELAVEDERDPFNSGLSIAMTLDKRPRHLERLSGGERLLVMLMLLFAIQMMKPMSFYLFDEIDASLDKENSKKLSLLIKELAGRSQFIVVTHNDSMISNSDTGIGIAMQERESRAIGIVLNKQQ